jgi:hypothetical protein
MLFVETPVFTKLVAAHLEDDEYRAIQVALLLRPEQGTVIRGSGVGGPRGGASGVA